VLKHEAIRLELITRPSNREGFKDGLGGLRAVPIFFVSAILASHAAPPADDYFK